MTPQTETIHFIGTITTPFATLGECPFHGNRSHAECTIEVFPPYAQGLHQVETCSHLIVFYWMDRADRNRRLQAIPKGRNAPIGHPGGGKVVGVHACHTPHRPNPIALTVVPLISLTDRFLTVEGLDCVSGTPLVDLKVYHPQYDYFPDAKVGWAGFPPEENAANQ